MAGLDQAIHDQRLSGVLSTTPAEIGIGLLVGSLVMAIVIAIRRPSLGAVLAWTPIWMPSVGFFALGVAFATDVICDEGDHLAFDKITRADTEVRIEKIFGMPDATARNGGRIWAEANPDGGTVFSFTLPLASSS